MESRVINVDLARVWEQPTGKGFIRTMGWGDYVTWVADADDHVVIRTHRFVEQPDRSLKAEQVDGYIKVPRGLRPSDITKPRSDNRVLKVNFVDVAQGDATVIETPDGQVMLIDGGQNQLLARYLAGRYRDTAETPLEVACIVVTHGDGDHFSGLVEIQKSETHHEPGKRLRIHPQRVYHSGLVKRPSTKDGHSVGETQLLGPTVAGPQGPVIVDLCDDLRSMDPAELNAPFRAWQAALARYSERGTIDVRRIERGDNSAFSFLPDGLKMEVLGPITTTVEGQTGLPFLGTPPNGVHLDFEPLQPTGQRFPDPSASHTINGHSVVLRMTYGGWRFMFAGDLNQEAELELVRDPAQLRAEVLKVPHHGSADFSIDFLKAVSPVVSVVSSGDESIAQEYIHPRASLVGALGRCSRIDTPLILVTELVAFFQVEGYVQPEHHKEGAGGLVEDAAARDRFFAFSRAAFGLVKVRTDGKRLLVYTDSGNVKLKEAYAYTMGCNGTPIPTDVVQA